MFISDLNKEQLELLIDHLEAFEDHLKGCKSGTLEKMSKNNVNELVMKGVDAGFDYSIAEINNELGILYSTLSSARIKDLIPEEK